MTAIARLVFPHQASGSLIVRDGKTVGSRLIGQPFNDPRTSGGGLASPFPYNAAASYGS